RRVQGPGREARQGGRSVPKGRARPRLPSARLRIRNDRRGAADRAAAEGDAEGSSRSRARHVLVQHRRGRSREDGPDLHRPRAPRAPQGQGEGHSRAVRRGKVPHEAFKETGRGEVNFAAFLPAAARAGVKYYYVEQDYSAGSPLDSLRTSHQALAALVA